MLSNDITKEIHCRIVLCQEPSGGVDAVVTYIHELGGTEKVA